MGDQATTNMNDNDLLFLVQCAINEEDGQGEPLPAPLGYKKAANRLYQARLLNKAMSGSGYFITAEGRRMMDRLLYTLKETD